MVASAFNDILCNIAVKNTTLKLPSGGRGGEVLPTIHYTGMLRLKGILFGASGMEKGLLYLLAGTG